MINRILFVDDDPHVLEAMRRILISKKNDWDMTFVTSAGEALEATGRIDFDAIITDIRMPKKDGFELLKDLVKEDRTKDIPVIVLTGDSERSLKTRALQLGATDLLNKPVSPEDLIARIQSVLRLKSYQDQLRSQNDLLEQKVRDRTIELEEARLDIIWQLAKAGEFRDEDTGNHVARVGCYCKVLAEEIGKSSEFIETIFLASPLHDIGKIGIPDQILLKPGKLTPEEWRIMKQHCQLGAEILLQDAKAKVTYFQWYLGRTLTINEKNTYPLLKVASTIALSHHERWDGKGYPKGLSGEEIPLESRIVSLADTFDALCSKRTYKPAFSEEKTLPIIQEESGHQFDPEVVRAFEKVRDQFHSIRHEFQDHICSGE